MKKLFTIGYEGADLPRFLETLVDNSVSLVLDVRELPISRRRGFSKNSLAAALEAVEIEYKHERDLGAPREIRHRLRDDQDLKRYFRDFTKYLATKTGKLEQLAKDLRGNVVLLCYERDYKECHRSIVARELGQLNNKVPVHLTLGEHGQIRNAASMRLGKGLSAV